MYTGHSGQSGVFDNVQMYIAQDHYRLHAIRGIVRPLVNQDTEVQCCALCSQATCPFHAVLPVQYKVVVPNDWILGMEPVGRQDKWNALVKPSKLAGERHCGDEVECNGGHTTSHRKQHVSR